MKKNPLVSIASLCLVFTFFLASCGTATVVATPTPYPTPVKKTYTVQRGNIVINADLFGSVTPLALETVYFQMDGHVGNVYVQVNDTVKKGELLADLQELQGLLATATTTQDAIQRAEDNLSIAQLTLDKDKANGADSYDIQIQQKYVDLAQLDLNEAEVKYGIDPKSTDPFGAINAQLDKARVYAPADGVIISGVNPGRAVSATTVAFTIGDGSHSEILASVDPTKSDQQFKDMFEGMPVVVTPNSQPTLQLSAKIKQLPSPYGTGNSNDTNVHVVLDQAAPAGALKIGDTVTVSVQLANKTGVLWLPPAAIREVGGVTFVIENASGGAKRIDVEIGLQTADKVEITSGLQEGQVVIGQ
jgi:macrolide-specific efflux system membrane fusion protein